MTTFPPIAEYGFLSDCENSCLVAPDGSVEWLCLPRPDSPSVFGALLDRSAGFFQFGPTKTRVPHQRRYTPGTMVMETTWHTPTGWLVVEDLLVIRPVGEDGRRQDYRRAPTDAAAVGTLLRTATCIGGRVEIAAACLPLFEYGLNVGSWSYQGDGYHSMVVRPPDDELSLTLTSSLRLGATGARCYGRTTLEDGESCFVALSWNGSAPTSFEDASADVDSTVEFWRNWLGTGTFPDHPWKRFLERSALTLKGLSYAPTGAIMAASTTSLPETLGGARNWDYRYTWIRDSAFMLRSLYRLGFFWEAAEYFAFEIEAISGGDLNLPFQLQIMYGIGGERDLTERTLDHLSGYRGSSRSGSATELGTSTRTTSGACSSTRSTSTSARTQPRSPRRSGRAGRPRRGRHRAPERPGSGHLGDSRRPTAVHRIQGAVLGGGGSGGRVSLSPTVTTNGPLVGERRPTSMKAEILEKGVDDRGEVPPALRER